MDGHFLFDFDLPTYGVNTCVWWAHNPKGKALVFVHGFAGQALATWSGFPSRLCGAPECEGWDIFFFGYDGRHTEAASSATLLGRLLDAMTSSPTNVFNESGVSLKTSRAHPRTYGRIVLVAHSLGAVVSRRAMLDGYARKPLAEWARNVELFLFAPAHLGAHIALLVREIFGPLAGGLVAIAQALKKYRFLRDLDATLGKAGSLERFHTLLHDTYKDTSPNAANLSAIGLVWKLNDTIVTNDRLPPDPAIDPKNVLADCTHSTVCKPTDSFEQPFSLLIAKL